MSLQFLKLNAPSEITIIIRQTHNFLLQKVEPKLVIFSYFFPKGFIYFLNYFPVQIEEGILNICRRKHGTFG